MEINIEEMTMQEYDEMIRGKDGPRMDRLSIEEMTMQEYEEMIRRRDGPRLDLPSFAINDSQGSPEFWAEDSTNTMFFEKKMHLDEAKTDLLTVFNNFMANSQRRMEEITEALDRGNIFETFTLINTDVCDFQVQEKELEIKAIDTTQSLPIVKASQPQAVVEPYHPPVPFPNRLKESGKLVNSISFVVTNSLLETTQEIIDEAWFEALLVEDAADVGSTKNHILKEGECLMVKDLCSMEAFDSEKDLQELDNLLKEFKVNLHGETAGYANAIIGHIPYSTIEVEKEDTHERFFATNQYVCNEVRHNMNPRHEELLLRETREWKDAWVIYCNALVQANEALFLDDCIEGGGNRVESSLTTQ